MQCAPAVKTLSGSGSKGSGGGRPYCARPGPVAASRSCGARALPQALELEVDDAVHHRFARARPGEARERLRAIALSHQSESIRTNGHHPGARSIGMAERCVGRDPPKGLGDGGDPEDVVMSTPVEHGHDIADIEAADRRRQRARRRDPIERQRRRGPGLRHGQSAEAALDCAERRERAEAGARRSGQRRQRPHHGHAGTERRHAVTDRVPTTRACQRRGEGVDPLAHTADRVERCRFHGERLARSLRHRQRGGHDQQREQAGDEQFDQRESARVHGCLVRTAARHVSGGADAAAGHSKTHTSIARALAPPPSAGTIAHRRT